MEQNIAQARTLLKKASKVIVLAGAGMSADIGTGTYWTGSDRQYGELISQFGFTQYEHAHGAMWITHREEQIQYYEDTLGPLVNNDVLAEGSPYRLLTEYLDVNDKDYFVVTSNVDAAFIRSGFDPEKLFEIHGSRTRSQCLNSPEGHGIFTTDVYSGKNTPCPFCSAPSRPNCLFFLDFDFNPRFTNVQQDKFFAYRDNIKTGEAIVLEIGAGTTIATIRNQGLRLNRDYDAPVIRINLHELDSQGGMENIIKRSVNAPIVGLAMTASAGLSKILE